MTRKQSLLPPIYLRDPMIQNEQSRNTTYNKDDKEQNHKTPRCDPQLWRIKIVEWHPRADVHETSAVEHEVYHGGEDLVFDLCVEVSVP